MTTEELVAEEKEPKLELNQFVISNKKLMTKVRHETVCRLGNKLKQLKRKSGKDDVNKVDKKNEKRAQNLEKELEMIKKFDLTDVLKFAIVNRTSFNDAVIKKDSTIEQRALCRLTDNEKVNKQIRSFLSTYPSMTDIKFAANTIQNMGAKYRNQRIEKYYKKGEVRSLMEKEKSLLLWIDKYTEASLPDTFKSYLKYFSELKDSELIDKNVMKKILKNKKKPASKKKKKKNNKKTKLDSKTDSSDDSDSEESNEKNIKKKKKPIQINTEDDSDGMDFDSDDSDGMNFNSDDSDGMDFDSEEPKKCMVKNTNINSQDCSDGEISDDENSDADEMKDFTLKKKKEKITSKNIKNRKVNNNSKDHNECKINGNDTIEENDSVCISPLHSSSKNINDDIKQNNVEKKHKLKNKNKRVEQNSLNKDSCEKSSLNEDINNATKLRKNKRKFSETELNNAKKLRKFSETVSGFVEDIGGRSIYVCDTGFYGIVYKNDNLQDESKEDEEMFLTQTSNTTTDWANDDDIESFQ